MTPCRATTQCLAVGAALLAALALLPPGAAAQAKIEATLASPNAVTFLIVRAESMFAAKVAEKTNGGLTIKVVTDGQLGGQKENIEAVLAGNLEFAQVNNAVLGTVYPNTQLFDLPFVFRDNTHMRHVVRGPIGQQIYAEYAERPAWRC